LDYSHSSNEKHDAKMLLYLKIYMNLKPHRRSCIFLFMVAPQGACLFAVGFHRQLWAWAGKNPIRLASFRISLEFLPLDLWATAKAQLCDTYFFVKGEWAGRLSPSSRCEEERLFL